MGDLSSQSRPRVAVNPALASRLEVVRSGDADSRLQRSRRPVNVITESIPRGR
jgi:hypothetical protein